MAQESREPLWKKAMELTTLESTINRLHEEVKQLEKQLPELKKEAQQERSRFYSDVLWSLNSHIYNGKNLDDSAYRIGVQKIVKDARKGHKRLYELSHDSNMKITGRDTFSNLFLGRSILGYSNDGSIKGLLSMIKDSCYGTKAAKAFIYNVGRYEDEPPEWSCSSSIRWTLEHVFERWGSVSYSKYYTVCWPPRLLGLDVAFTRKRKTKIV